MPIADAISFPLRPDAESTQEKPWRRCASCKSPRPNGAFELVERPIPEPGAGSVRIRVQACGICHSDSLTKEGRYPGIQYPRVPGHEVAGVIDAVGPGVAGGSRASAWASAGTADIAGIATTAAVASSLPA